MSEAKKRVPKRRFKEFLNAGDWEQRNLLTVLNKIVDYRGRTPKKLGLDWSPTGHLALSALNVKMGYVDKTVDAHYGDDHLYSVWMKDNDLYEGQVLFTTEAPMGNVAQVPDNNKYILSQRTIAFVPDRSVISDNFLAVVLSASKCQKSLINRASGGTAKGVSQKTLSEISLDIPQSLSEQDKVSELIKKLSKIITIHQRKLDKLQAAKKALLQEMFPEAGQDKPKRRFKGFTDAWEQRKLIYIFNDFIVPMRDKPKVFSGTTPWTRIEDIEGRYINTSLSGQFVSDETIKSMNLKVIPKGSLIVSASATFGVVAIVNNDLITNQTFIGLVPNKDFDIDFLYSLFEAPSTKNKLLKLSAGSTIFYIARESFENLVLSVPSKEEQIKISKIFKSIDNSITLHQRKLDKFKNLKQAYLNEMFV